MTTLQTLVANSGTVTQIGENFDATSPAGMYGRRAPAVVGLTWAFYGGQAFGNTVANGTVALTASTTNYVVASRTTGAVSVSTSITNWNDTTNYYRCYLIVTGASTITTATDYREFVGGSTAGGFTGGTLTSALNEAPPVTIASGLAPSATAIGAALSNTVIISGTTAITGFDTIAAGAIRRLRFTGVLTLTHNGTSLILPAATNITTAAGDVATMESLGSGNWRCIDYARADGTALVGGSGSGTVTSVDASGGVETTSGSAITGTGAVRASTLVNAQTGTTYTYLTGDRGKLVTHSNASAIAATLPQATGTFPAGWFMRVKNRGAGTLTITPTTSTIDGAASLALTTGQWSVIVSDGTNYQATTYAPSSGGGALSNWTEAVNSSAPNGTVPVVSLTATNAATNVDAAIVPKGTGAILAGVPDGTTTGGAKRGIYAADLQRNRSVASQVASGDYTFLAGNSNTASGSGSSCAGGNSNLASGTNSWIPGGSAATTRGITGMGAFAAGSFSANGDAQVGQYVLRRQGTDATTIGLSSVGAAPAAATTVVLPDSSVFHFMVRIAARNSAAAAAYKIEGCIKRGTGVGTVALVGTPTVTTVGADAGASSWLVTVAANTTLGSLDVQVTGAAATNIKWLAHVETVEVGN